MTELWITIAVAAAAAIVIKFLFAGGDPNTIQNFIRPETKPIR